MKKRDVFHIILDSRSTTPKKKLGRAFAPSNIALCKYWGKRNEELNLPITSSISVSLGHLGTETTIAPAADGVDTVILNDKVVPAKAAFAKGVTSYLNLLAPNRSTHFTVNTKNSIPTAAGLASSASGFAALILSLNDLFEWKLDGKSLSILARLGSGSASRSIFTGFVEWMAGASEDGMDSYAEKLPIAWDDFRLGLLTVSDKAKDIASRQAMKRTRRTSPLFEAWPVKAQHDLVIMKDALQTGDFDLVGKTAESNALSMHATSLGAWPPILFWLPESVALMHRIWALREAGMRLYFTMDAGPNVKLLFLAPQQADVEKEFPGVQVVAPFA